VTGSYVKVRLVCSGCHEEVTLCMSVPRHIPPKIACNPGSPASIASGGDGGPYLCPRCHRCWNLTSSQLRAVVAERVRRDLGEAMQAGAVVVECG